MKNVHDVNTNDTKERYIAVRSRVHHQNEKQKTLSSAQIRKRAAILFLIRVSHISVNKHFTKLPFDVSARPRNFFHLGESLEWCWIAIYPRRRF